MREELKLLKYRGTQVAYFVVCKRKLWLFTKGLGFEHLSERVALGKFLDEVSFQREKGVNFYDEPVSIDFIKSQEGLVVHEIKSSDALEEAHLFQVKYYLYYLKNKGVKISHGILHYPKQKKIKKVYLTSLDEEILESALKQLEEVINLPLPPTRVEKPYCKKCAYYEFCYG